MSGVRRSKRIAESAPINYAPVNHKKAKITHKLCESKGCTAPRNGFMGGDGRWLCEQHLDALKEERKINPLCDTRFCYRVAIKNTKYCVGCTLYNEHTPSGWTHMSYHIWECIQHKPACRMPALCHTDECYEESTKIFDGNFYCADHALEEDQKINPPCTSYYCFQIAIKDTEYCAECTRKNEHTSNGWTRPSCHLWECIQHIPACIKPGFCHIEKCYEESTKIIGDNFYCAVHADEIGSNVQEFCSSHKQCYQTGCSKLSTHVVEVGFCDEHDGHGEHDEHGEHGNHDAEVKATTNISDNNTDHCMVNNCAEKVVRHRAEDYGFCATHDTCLAAQCGKPSHWVADNNFAYCQDHGLGWKDCTCKTMTLGPRFHYYGCPAQYT
ncbi:MAG: hypothetical protein Faunusvirus2_49 [Faunusvirus sp.]|jgi:hypothetical protein|uniref:Uncharacterized protein n=1 Tax=Faunusvirus sp. TaxID=2487766 RepID=A0A3G4ZW24_9VIRU|nr:MAG: hypothetical protein Faunusvirus2_49 [Faunusvirus sp.]